MRGYTRYVPAVYDQFRGGATEADFEAMRTSADPQQREIGNAYHHLFSPSGYSDRIEAEYVDGQGLVVQRGRHRVEEARELGIDYLPVHVRAENHRTLNTVVEGAEKRGPGCPAVGGDGAERQYEHGQAGSPAPRCPGAGLVLVQPG